MKAKDFLTVPDELLECAHAARQHFKDWGFQVAIEPAKIDYPLTPTMVCKQQDRTLIVEVHSGVVRDRIEDWATYCASCDRNRELALCVPPKHTLSSSDMTLLREMRVGLYVAGADGVEEVFPPMDLAMRVELPNPANLSMEVRKALSEMYDLWNRGDWKQAFGNATEVLEEQAREYLKRESSRGRLVVLAKNGKPQALTAKKVDKMTLGGIATAFAKIQAPTDVDSTIGAILARINGDRVRLRHHRTKEATQAGFRRRVGPHMHMIVRAIKEAIAKK